MRKVDVAQFGSAAALPGVCRAWLGAGPLTGAAWYGALAAHAVPPGSAPAFAVVMKAGEPAAMLILLRASDGGLGGFTTPYTLAFVPGLGDAGVAGRAVGQVCRAQAQVRLDAIDAAWPQRDAFVAGVRDAGWVVQPFAHFGNWSEPIVGRGWVRYLADRAGPLRTTIARKLKRTMAQAVLEVVQGGPALEPAIAAYEAVYAVSWKEPEPYPAFNPALMRLAAAQGALRLGVLRVGGQPVAVQFWVVWEGTATVLKLAHDGAFAALSPGTVLTALMIERLIDEERVQTLDFGRGDDPYKAMWTTQRRPFIGLMLLNPRRPAGLAAIGRGLAGRLRRGAWA